MPRAALPLSALDGILHVAFPCKDPRLRDTCHHTDLWHICNGIEKLGNALDAFLPEDVPETGRRHGLDGELVESHRKWK